MTKIWVIGADAIRDEQVAKARGVWSGVEPVPYVKETELDDALDALYEISCVTNEDMIYEMAIETFRKLTARKANA